MAEQTDPSQPAESPEAEAKRMLVDTLAEQQALAALDEMIAKADSGPELSGAAPGSERHDQPPSEAYALTGDVPPYDGWYVAMKDNAQGPFTVDELKERWSSGDFLADTLCWREGMGEWRPLSRLHGLAAAIAPRPREGLKSLSSKPPVRTASQPGFAPSAASTLRSLAEQESKSKGEAKPSQEGKTSPQPPPTAPTTPDGPRKVQPPAVKPPVFAAGIPAPELDDDEPEKRPAGVSGAKLFFSLLSASVLGGLVGGGLVKMTLPPPPEPVVVEEPAPPSPRPVPVAAPSPPAEPPKAEPKVEARPKVAKPPPEASPDAQPKPPKKPDTPPPPPKDQLDKDFQDTFGK